MNRRMIAELILTDAFELYGQPKWTFGKNTCNTYQVFVEKVTLLDGSVIPAWPLLDLIETDAELTRLFSEWFLKTAMRTAVQLGDDAEANLTLSILLFPHFAESDRFAETVLRLLEETGLAPQKLQFELSEAQKLTTAGVEALNLLHDEHGVGLWLSNFGTGYANIDLLRDVHFDGVELDPSYASRIPECEQTCRMVIAIQHMLHTLDLKLCAKGIETQEQFEFFEELDFFKGQGPLIGKPMNMQDIHEYICNFAVKRSS